MVEVGRVYLFDTLMGHIRWDEQRSVAQFEYDAHFAGLGIEPAPLMMPVRRGQVYSFPALQTETFRGLPGLLADALPDTYGRALFDRWLALTGRTAANPVEMLCFMGKRSMGALEFEPTLEEPHGGAASIEVQSLIEVAREALEQKASFSTHIAEPTALAELLRLGTSAGGQRAKAIVAYNKQTGEVRSGQVAAPEGFVHYLIKLDGVSGTAEKKQTHNYARLEYAYYLMARDCGIQMSDSQLLEEGGRTHFLTQRFDRIGNKKLHTQTLCGMAHYDYRLPRAYSYEQLFAVMRALRLPYSDAQEMFRRMVFNIVARNQDDHTKNVSFLMNDQGKWQLAPAYDMVYSYNPLGQWTATHQMSVNGHFAPISRADLLACAAQNNIKNAAEIIDEVCTTVSRFPYYAALSGVSHEKLAAIQQTLELTLD